MLSNISSVYMFISGWWALILITFALLILTYILAVVIVLNSKIRYKGTYLSDEPALTDINSENMNTVPGSGSSFYDTSTMRQFQTPANYSEYSPEERDIEISISQLGGKVETLMSRSLSNSSSKSNDGKVDEVPKDAQSEKDIRNKVYDFFRRSFNFNTVSKEQTNEGIYDTHTENVKAEFGTHDPISPTSSGLRKRKSSIYDQIPSGTSARTFSLRSSVQAHRASSDSWSRTDTTATMGAMMDLSEPTYDISKTVDLPEEAQDGSMVKPSLIYDVAKTEEDYSTNQKTENQTLGTSVQASLASSDVRDYTSTEIPYDSLKSYDLKSLLKDPSLTGISAAELRSKVLTITKTDATDKSSSSSGPQLESEPEKSGKSVTYDYLTQSDVQSIISRFSDYTTINPDDSISNVGIYSDYLSKRSERSKQEEAPLTEHEPPKSIYKSLSAYGNLSRSSKSAMESQVYKPLSSASTKSRVSFSLGPDHDENKYSLGSTSRMRKSTSSRSSNKRSVKSSDSGKKSGGSSAAKSVSENSSIKSSTATASTVKKAVSESSSNRSTVRKVESSISEKSAAVKTPLAPNVSSKSKTSSNQEERTKEKSSNKSSKTTDKQTARSSAINTNSSKTKELEQPSESTNSTVKSKISKKTKSSDKEPSLNAETSVSNLTSVRSKIKSLESSALSQPSYSSRTAKSRTLSEDNNGIEKSSTTVDQYQTESTAKSIEQKTSDKSSISDVTSSTLGADSTTRIESSTLAKSKTPSQFSTYNTTDLKTDKPNSSASSSFNELSKRVSSRPSTASTIKETSESTPVSTKTATVVADIATEHSTTIISDKSVSSPKAKTTNEYSEIKSSTDTEFVSQPEESVHEPPEYGNLADNRDQLIAMNPDTIPKTSAFAKFQKMIRPSKNRERDVEEKVSVPEDRLNKELAVEDDEPERVSVVDEDRDASKSIIEPVIDPVIEPTKKEAKKGFGKKLLGKLQRTKDKDVPAPIEEEYRNLGSYVDSKPDLYETSSSEITESSYEDEDYSYYYSDSTVAALLKEHPGETLFSTPNEDAIWPEDITSQDSQSYSSSYTESESSQTLSSEYSTTHSTTESDSSSSSLTMMSRRSDRTSVVSGKTLTSLSSFNSSSYKDSVDLDSRATGLSIGSTQKESPTYYSDSSVDTDDQTDSRTER